ncbi:folate-binding protein [Microbacterium sp. LRZ72]|uniref:CAF17-like 4Fe-4S cluster assembly/insertion protein YgfZ n=1 Tax=Microbacterium sp. LRZ72 TaxID=2942481 RepID=UPI0029B21D3D|nr:glycine cleavage T C-terminal barrel domain-containing protein [Microbacterium sp. LRZ72]MDX2375958.1 folate-binding protein [Microbacterium sp. LRZ72]
MTASPFSDLPGAVSPGSAPEHFGNPVREQVLLERGEAIVHLGDRAVISVSGPERLTWLDSITSQALAALAPGVSTELLVLDPHGHIEHQAAVLDDGETTWLVADAPDAAALEAWLRRMVFRSQVTVSAAAEVAVVGAVAQDGRMPQVLDAHVRAPAGIPLVWIDPWRGVAEGGVQYAAASPHPGSRLAWALALVPADDLAQIAAQLGDGPDGIRPAGLLAAEALRIAAWRPRRSGDVDERTLPHELDWLRSAVHLSKGCYRGQETVAKVHNLGHPPRRMVFLHLDGSGAELPQPGAEVRHDGKSIGRVTSAALHHEQGPIALAVVKRTAPIDQPLTVAGDDGDIAASAEVIVPPEAGAAAAVPRLPRLSSRARS